MLLEGGVDGEVYKLLAANLGSASVFIVCSAYLCVQPPPLVCIHLSVDVP